MSKSKTEFENAKPEERFESTDPISTAPERGEYDANKTGAASTTEMRHNPPAPQPRVQPMPERDIYEEYGDEISARKIVGQLLRFSKGDWLYGTNKEDLPVGKHLIANMDELLLGWIRWEDQKPADQRMGLLIEGFKAPDRDTLGYGYEPGTTEPDTSEWEVDEKTGTPRDPWQFTYYLVMKDPDEKDEIERIYTFTTASKGGTDCIGDLCKIYGRKRRQGYKDFYPVVALKVGHYDHPNKQMGRIKTPHFPVVGWVAKSVFGELPEPTDITQQIADQRDEKDIPF
jgi:hypothetical protein